MQRTRAVVGFGAALLIAAAGIASAPASAQVAPGLYAGMQWRLIGPFRGGRTVGVSGVPAQPGVFYMAPSNGGVWKSTDYGRTWVALFEHGENNSVGDLAVAPSAPNVIYVGSGEGLLRPDLSIGDGLYKSTDAGRTWQHLGLRDAQQIGSIIVDPHDPNRLFVAAMGHPYGPNPERGVFRSTDGGKSFQQVLYKGPNVGAIQVEFDPADPRTVYAVLWAGRNTPWHWQILGGVEGSGLYKSTDGGSTWRQIGKGLPSVAQGLGRIGIGIAPSRASRVYALVEAPAATGGEYVSNDGGENFQRINTDERVIGRGADFAEIKVAPDNPDEVYVANTSVYRSRDGGHSFTAISGAPGGDDFHRIWIDPTNANIMILGVDQGATVSVNRGETWSTWYNQPTAQSYHVITDNAFPYRVYSSQQESGSMEVLSRSNDGQITFRDWHPVGAEEYAYIAPDPLNPDLVYGGKVTRYNRVTGETQFVGPQLGFGPYRFNRTAPLIFSPADPHALYLGSNVLFKTTNGGHDWKIISPDLSRPNPGVPPNLAPFAGHVNPLDHRGVIYSIGPSFRSADTLWAGTDDGLIWLTRDGGAHWSNVTPRGMTSWSKVAQLVASHFDDDTAYAAVNRFRLDDLKPYIYRTHDGGKTWQLIVQGLPDNAPVNVVREDPVQKGLLYAGTERAIWFSADDGAHWNPLQFNLPQTSMRDLVIHDNDVVVGTHGRSLWILDDITPLRQLSAAQGATTAYLYRPAPAWQVPRNTWSDTELPKEEPAGQNPPSGAILDYYLKAPATGPVTLAIYDGAGALVRGFSSADLPKPLDPEAFNFPTWWIAPEPRVATGAGAHRFVWDLHYPKPQVFHPQVPMGVILHSTPVGPLGPAALPGNYTVKLTVDGQTFSQPLEVRQDPRNHATAAELQQQFALAQQAEQDIDRVYAAIAAAGSDAARAAKLRALHGKLLGLYESLYGGDMSSFAGPTTLQVQTAGTLHGEVAAALGN